jgi:hypothetical protein
MTFIIPAHGPRYSCMAARMRDSAVAHGWKGEFIIAGDDSADSFGRDAKTGFGRYLSDDMEGPVVLMDADMIATGPLELPVSDQISAIWMDEMHWHDTFFTIFPSVEVARRFSAAWNALWHKTWIFMRGRDDSSPLSDGRSFNLTLEKFPRRRLDTPNRSQPFPTLRHLIREKYERD